MYLLIYIHGFQGNDTSFQSFPTHLQKYLTVHVPPHTTVKSCLYPTYKSVKPLSYATRNFLAWLDTQPPSDVILIGHSMGGLLAAEAATVASSRRTNANTIHRVVGLVAFDVPFLGMHPHVILSGIASLFPDSDKKGKTEREMNDESQVHFVDQSVTEEPASQQHLSPPSVQSQQLRSPSPDPESGLQRFFDWTVNLIQTVSDDPIVVWLRKHKDDTYTAARKVVTEHMQFAGCMFHPSGLRERYAKLVAWDGPWVNYWTSTLPRNKETKGEAPNGEPETQEIEENDLALLQTGITDLETTPAVAQSPVDLPLETDDPRTREKKERRIRKEQEKLAKQAEKQRKSMEKARAKKEKEGKIPPRHFIVLPTGLGSFLGGQERWERVYIGGVEDEVQAHCGLFKPSENLEYDAFVEQVGRKVLEFINNA